VVDALRQDPAPINALYAVTQKALVEAVNSVHIPWASIPETSLAAIKAVLRSYSFVYSTNYDLILYWAVMHDGPTGFTDYFFGSRFDLSNTEVWGQQTKVMFLHGGLHLYRELSGQTLKRKAGRDKTCWTYSALSWSLPPFLFSSAKVPPEIS
jgi:hypothetical protein